MATHRSRRRTSVPLLSAEEQRAWLEAIMESVDNAIIGKRLDGTIVMWSVGAERLYGYAPAEALGRSIRMLVPEDVAPELGQVFSQLQRGQAVPPHETVRVAKDGRRLDVSLTVNPVRDRQGHVIGAWAMARDITTRRATERQLVAAKEAAEQANAAKDRFLAVLSHELRTPLTPVLAAITNLFEAGGLSEEVSAALRIVRRNVELESRLIDDLLDLTRISRGKLTLELESVEPGQLLRDAVDICGEALRAKDIEVRAEIEPCGVARGDAARLRQVFWNLLDNAAKFSPRGSRVDVRCRAEGGDLVIEIEDRGRGIDPSLLTTIFEAFEQGDPAAARGGAGLGLGLAICKALVSLHGGSVEAHSEGPGTGALFRVRLPRVSDRSPPRRRRATTPMERAPDRPLRILLVEDHEDSAILTKALLERWGHTVELADRVERGLLLALAHPPDLIVTDLGLPDGSGHDLLARVREAGIDAPGIALSGYGMEGDLAASRRVGFAAHLVKPVGVKRLREALRRAAARED